MSFSEPPLTESWRLIKQLLDSGTFSSLPVTEQARWLQWAELHAPECAIERAIVHASEKQRQFQKYFFDRADQDGKRKDFYIAMGGNRSGKSFSCGWLCFALYLRDHAKEGDWFWCIAKTLPASVGGQQREIWEALPRWMFGDQVWEPKNGFGGHAKLVLPTQDNGKCLVEFRSADQDLSTFEQAKLTGAWADEKISEALYGRLIPRLVDRRGFFLYSDIFEQFWQQQRLAKAPMDAGVYFQHFSMYDNEANLPPGEITIASARMSTEERDQKIHGLLLRMEGIVYKQYKDNIHTIEDFDVGPTSQAAKWPKWRAIDYGGSNPTACVWFTIDPDENCYIYREHYEKNLEISLNAELIRGKSVGETYVATLIDPHAIDKPPAYYGQSPTIARQYEAAGIKTRGWPYIQTLGEHACVNTVKKRLEDRKLFVFKSCIHTRREFGSWTYQLDKDGHVKPDEPYGKENNHTLDCIKGFFATKPAFTQLKSASERRGT